MISYGQSHTVSLFHHFNIPSSFNFTFPLSGLYLNFQFTTCISQTKIYIIIIYFNLHVSFFSNMKNPSLVYSLAIPLVHLSLPHPSQKLYLRCFIFLKQVIFYSSNVAFIFMFGFYCNICIVRRLHIYSAGKFQYMYCLFLSALNNLCIIYIYIGYEKITSLY